MKATASAASGGKVQESSLALPFQPRQQRDPPAGSTFPSMFHIEPDIGTSIFDADHARVEIKVLLEQ
jgi:hypothetical protein